MSAQGGIQSIFAPWTHTRWFPPLRSADVATRATRSETSRKSRDARHDVLTPGPRDRRECPGAALTEWLRRRETAARRPNPQLDGGAAADDPGARRSARQPCRRPAHRSVAAVPCWAYVH